MFGRRWSFSCGTGAGVGAIGWPANAILVENEEFWVPDKNGAPHWLPIIDFESWVAVPYDWYSHLKFRAMSGDFPTETPVAARGRGAPDRILRVVACRAFAGITTAPLRRIARDLGCQIDPSSGEIGIVISLIRHVLGAVSDEDMLRFLSHRRHEKHAYLDFMLSPEAAEIMMTDDRKEMQKVSEDIQAGAVEQASLKSTLASLRASVAQQKASASGSRGNRGSAAPFGGQKFPAKLSLTEPRTSQEEVAKFLPPGSRLLADQSNNRWLLSFDGQRLSRSWGLYGYNEGAILILRLAWQAWSDSRRTPPCPIAGIIG